MTEVDAEIEELRQALAEHDAANPRAQRKLGRSLGHKAMMLAKAEAGRDVADLDLMVSALMAGARAHSYPQRYLAAQAHVMAQRRVMTGQENPKIVWEKARTIDVEMGALALFDAETGLADVFFEAGGGDFAAAMNDGAFFTIAMPGDGAVKVRLRVIAEGPLEPAASEFRRMRGATPTGQLVAPSGTLRLHGGGKIKLDAPVVTDRLAIRAYHLGAGRSQAILIIAGPLGDQRVEPLVDAPALDIY